MADLFSSTADAWDERIARLAASRAEALRWLRESDGRCVDDLIEALEDSDPRGLIGWMRENSAVAESVQMLALLALTELLAAIAGGEAQRGEVKTEGVNDGADDER